MGRKIVKWNPHMWFICHSANVILSDFNMAVRTKKKWQKNENWGGGGVYCIAAFTANEKLVMTTVVSLNDDRLSRKPVIVLSNSSAGQTITFQFVPHTSTNWKWYYSVCSRSLLQCCGNDDLMIAVSLLDIFSSSGLPCHLLWFEPKPMIYYRFWPITH